MEENRVLRAFGAVDLVVDKKMVVLEWVASPINDMYADGVLCAVLQVCFHKNDLISLVF